MKLQKNLLLIPVVVAGVWGLFGLFAPEALMKLLNTPSESINPSLISTHMSLAIAQICLAIFAFWMRSLTDKKAMTGAMSVVALAFLLFGLEGVLVNLIVEGHQWNMFLLIQSIVFIVLAALFFLKRNPK
jgi:H+/Cl- antiporter ClcA